MTDPIATPPDSDVLDFCCKKKKCPRFERAPDGAIVVTDSELPGVAIRLSAEQAERVGRWLLRQP